MQAKHDILQNSAKARLSDRETVFNGAVLCPWLLREEKGWSFVNFCHVQDARQDVL
jgi:hypothetical protein